MLTKIMNPNIIAFKLLTARRSCKTRNSITINNCYSKISATHQGQKFVAVIKAKNRGAATSQNAKNRGIVAAKIVKIAAMSRQKS
jgi:hypothetical protein